jgi:cruciform cutting endonuclease 1
MSKSPIFALPSTLKLAHLRILAIKCGVSLSGPKPILAARINSAVTSASNESATKIGGAPLRILSIDMGIRNLAYCVLDALPDTGGGVVKPQIKAWHRLSVSSTPKPLVRYDVPIENTGSNLKHPPIEKKPIEPFDPAALSLSAYTLLTRTLLPLQPTHILIERQRFRSSSGPHVLEWTLRVNMFESIIYAILTTLKEEGVWSGTVQPITPGKIGPFWLGEDKKPDEQIRPGDYKRVSKAKNVKLINKGKKMDLVRSWLEHGHMVTLGNEKVEKMAEMYKEKWDRKPGGQVGPRKTKKIEKEEEEELEKKGIPKLDDLADCLLQGMAWLEWENNKRILMKEGGINALLEEYDNERFKKLIDGNANLA